MLLDGRFRFDNFVVGAANRLAVAAARAVAESPGAVYNPLFIYSGSGLGKTHLIGAIAHAAKSAQPSARVVYVPLDDFVDDLHLAISSGQAEAFKRRYQETDLLLLDDVQFLTGRRETQSEMLRILNAMQEGGRQIVMASDRPPAEIRDVDERLITRLSGGLIVDIGMPEFETRVAILRHKCQERALAFAPGVLEELARLPLSNVRELQGALNRIVAHQSLLEQALTAADVRTVLGAMRTPTPPRVVAAEPEAASLGGFGGDEFESFLSDVAVAVAQGVDSWRVRLGERVAHWQGLGYRTAMLEQVLTAVTEPDVDALEAQYEAAVARLEAIEAEAVLLDASLAGDPAFRDPEHPELAVERLERAIAAAEPPPAPDPSRTFATFERGVSNQLALRAAESVLMEPGSRYNPLYLHGPSGTGKTHLLHALGNALREPLHATGPIACVRAEVFVDELIAAIQAGTVERWRARYRHAAALIVDDVHALAGKERTQDELFHLFNHLYAAGRQVVLASDRAPGELPELVERLRSRFDGGLVVALQPPDRALREALFKRALADEAPEADPSLAAALAEPPLSSASEVKVAVDRLVQAARAMGEPVSTAVVQRAFGGRRPSPAAIPTADDTFFLDAEKIVTDWPGVDGRVIEELG